MVGEILLYDKVGIHTASCWCSFFLHCWHFRGGKTEEKMDDEEHKEWANPWHVGWPIYNDLSRGHPKWWFSKGIPPKMALN